MSETTVTNPAPAQVIEDVPSTLAKDLLGKLPQGRVQSDNSALPPTTETPPTQRKLTKMGFPKKERIYRIKPKEVMPIEYELSERELKIKEKYGIEPQTGLKERGVRFDDPEQEGPAWGVEAYIPISDTIRNILKRKAKGGIDIPERITGILYLDLATQESVYPVSKRTIRTPWQTKLRFVKARGILDRLREASAKDAVSELFAFLYNINMSPSSFNPEIKKADALAELLINVFYDREKIQKKFNQVLAQGKGTNLVIVQGHGGGKKRHVMGEQNNDVSMSGEHVAQRAGNRVFTDEIIERYNDPKTFAALIFCACNMEGAKIGVKDVPIVHPLGASGNGTHPFESVVSTFENRAYIKVPRTG